MIRTQTISKEDAAVSTAHDSDAADPVIMNGSRSGRTLPNTMWTAAERRRRHSKRERHTCGRV